MNALQLGGSIALGTSIAVGVGVGGTMLEAPMAHGAERQSNGDRFVADFGTVFGVVDGGVLAYLGRAYGNPWVGAAGIGVATGSIAARIGASQLGG